MIEAPALAACSALRRGCGLCAVAVPAPILSAVLSIVPAATGVALPVDENEKLFAAGCAQVIDQALINIDALVVGQDLGANSRNNKLSFALQTPSQSR